MPRITVIINSCNTAEYLGQAIDSVLGQSRPADEIIVSDVSTDNSRAIIGTYADRAPHISTTFNEPNGQLAQIIAGLKQSTGDLIFLLDGDDRYSPTHLEQMEHYWQRFPKSDVFYCRHRVIGQKSIVDALLSHEKHEDGHWLGPIDVKKEYDWGISTALAYCHPNYHIGNITSTLSFRRNHFRKLPIQQLYDSHPNQLEANADYILLLASALSGGRKAYAPVKTVEYRLHERSLTGRKLSGDMSSLATQQRCCTIARSWLRCQPGFGPELCSLLETEMAMVPLLSEGHKLFYEEAHSSVQSNAHMHTELATQPKRLEQLANEIGALRSENRALLRALDEKCLEVNASQERTDRLLQSTCWRVTAPARFIVQTMHAFIARFQRNSDGQTLELPKPRLQGRNPAGVERQE